MSYFYTIIRIWKLLLDWVLGYKSHRFCLKKTLRNSIGFKNFSNFVVPKLSKLCNISDAWNASNHVLKYFMVWKPVKEGNSPHFNSWHFWNSCTFREKIHCAYFSPGLPVDCAAIRQSPEHFCAWSTTFYTPDDAALVFPWFSKVTNLTPAHPSSACWRATLFRCYRVTQVAAQFDTLFNIRCTHFLFLLLLPPHWCGRRDAAHCKLYDATRPMYKQRKLIWPRPASAEPNFVTYFEWSDGSTWSRIG